MNIYELIERDHDKAKGLMRQIKALPDERHEERLQLYYPLMEDLLIHNESEEETFYRALMESALTENDAKHSEKEHHEAADVMDKLCDDHMEAGEWRVKFDELCSDLMHHIHNEENRVFDEARAVLSPAKAIALAEEMAQLKMRKKATVKEHHAELAMHVK